MDNGEVQELREQVADLHRKVDALTAHMEAMARRQAAWDDLRRDLTPVVNDAWHVLVDEMSHVDRQFALEDLVHLGRKALRNTRKLTTMLDLAVSLHDLLEDATPLGKEVLATAVGQLDHLEREGYFTFGREAWALLDRVVHRFSPADLRQMGDDLMRLAETGFTVTRPEVVRPLEAAAQVLRAGGEVQPIGVIGLVRAMRDPEVRQGLGLLVRVLRSLPQPQADPPAADGAAS